LRDGRNNTRLDYGRQKQGFPKTKKVDGHGGGN
jgi:hypothetical protein